GMIASSRVESVNAYIQDKENEYRFWRLAITNIKNQDKANFLFTQVDKCLQKFLISIILQMQHNKINQSVYYISNIITIDAAEHFDKDDQLINNQEKIDIDSSRVSFKQLIDFAIKVGNSLKTKHCILLLKNQSHLCSCLHIIRYGIVYRHYFQVMLAISNAKFHIQMLPSRWYHTKENRNKEPFLIADKFFHDLTTELSNTPIPCLYLFRQNDYDFRENNLITSEQKITYGSIHG
ncbi:580_t:CDS:2, partial [Funneliformis geosporum]